MRGRRAEEAIPQGVLDAIGQTMDVANRVAAGDLEARLGPLHLGPAHAETERGLRAAFNGMLDVVDAYVRESAAAIVAASRHHYYRRLLEPGLSGAFLDGALVIEAGREAMEASHDAARSATQARQDLAARLEESLVGLTQEMTSAAESMGATAAGVADYAREARSEAQQARGTVESLRASTEEIRSAVGLITQIADQTRMLALNATIEAARAGDAGRGFAIVATEVKGLADESGESSKSIIAGVTAVKEAARSTIDVLESVTDRITEMSRRVEEIVAAAQGSGDGGGGGLIPVAEHLRSEVDGFVEAIRSSERRGARRTELRHPVTIVTGSATLTGTLRNVSLTGVRFDAPQDGSLAVGRKVRLTVDTEKGLLDLTCEILRVVPSGNDEVGIAARVVYKRPPYDEPLDALLREGTPSHATA